jgi:hypothetical protein
MTSIIITNLDDTYYEVEEEFKKLALLVPTIPKDQILSELEIIEFVIAYIRQLQQLLSYDQWNEHINKLTSSSHLFNQLVLQSPKSSTSIRRNPLAIINLDNTELS